MTGRRLYDLMCDEWAKETQWAREKAEFFPQNPPFAWAFLKHADRATFNRVAARIKSTKR